MSHPASESIETAGTVLFITSAHPGGGGVIGAGEGISESSVRTLVALGHTVHVLCFAAPNQNSNPAVVRLCASYTTWNHSPAQTVLAMLYGWRRGSVAAPWLFTRVSPRNVSAVKAALARHGIDRVWLDFPSSLGFAPWLGGEAATYFVHDVVSQKVGRKVLLALLEPVVKAIECRLVARVQRCVVLSDKDEGLLRTLGFSGEIALAPPQHLKVGVVEDAMPITQVLAGFSGNANLVFFGNMRRAENHWSLVHFVLWVYPTIRRARPDARLWILGLGPRRLLKWAARWAGGVNVVGAVDDPTQAFVQASLCIAPLRLGAGVKIKVLQMLEAGASVVATSVGAEGIPAQPRLRVVAERDFAEAVITHLRQIKAGGVGDN